MTTHGGIAVGTAAHSGQSEPRSKGCEVVTEMMAPCCDRRQEKEVRGHWSTQDRK